MMTESNFEGSKYWMGIVTSRWAFTSDFFQNGLGDLAGGGDVTVEYGSNFNG